MNRIETVDDYLASVPQWKAELLFLRSLMLQAGFTETLKWGAPAYTQNGKNVVGMVAFKNYVAIWFWQGALLKDETGKLINAQDGNTKALRQWRFSSMADLELEAELVLCYLEEARQNQLDEKRIKPERNKPLVIPAELAAELLKDRQLQECFDKLSLTDRRDYAEYIATAKRAETRQSRLDKIIPLILDRKGLNDKYK